MRLVRGAFRKDFQDRFEVERELFSFTLAYEKLAQETRDPEDDELLVEEHVARVSLDDLADVLHELLARPILALLNPRKNRHPRSGRQALD